MDRSRNRRFRSRPPTADEDEDGVRPAPAGQAAVNRTNKGSKDRRKADGVKKATLLSFEDEEEGGAAPVAAAPRRSTLAAPVKAGRDSSVTTSTQISAPGEYSTDRLQELRNETQSIPGAKPKSSTAMPAGGFKLSGSFKAVRKATDDRFEVNASDMMKGIRKEPRREAPILPPPLPRPLQQPVIRPATAPTSQPTAAAAAATAGDDHSDEDGAAGFTIPDKEAIRRAKEKRERLRSAHLAPDYIPLGGAAALTSNQDAAARLRGDAAGAAAAAHHSGSDSEEEPGADMRMNFVGGSARSAGAGVFSSVADDREGDGEEDEDDAWVRQQLQKAGANRLGPSPPPTDGHRQAGMHAPARGAMANDPAATATVAGQAVLSSLQQGFARLQEQQKHTERQRKQTEANLEDAVKAIAQLETDVAAASRKYTYLQETRSFIADMCDMLQEKTPYIEVLDERLGKAAEDRATAAAATRVATDTEELAASQAAIGAAIGVLSRGGAMVAAQAAADSAADAAEQAAISNLPVELDEFGRDLNVEKRKQAEERLAKRRLRRATAGDAVDFSGYASEAEDQAEVDQYNKERMNILEAAATVFADADEQYRSAAAVKQRLVDWQTAYPAAYRDAYMAVSAPAIFAPFVRLQLLSWDPLFGSSTGFDSQEWYQLLFDFGMPQTDAAPPGEDADAVPILVRNCVAPLALAYTQHVWDPVSWRQTRAIHSILQDLLAYVAPDNKTLQDIIKTVHRRLEEGTGQVNVPRWPAQALQATPRAARFAAQQFGRAIRVLQAVGCFEDVLDHSALQKLAIDQLLKQQVMPMLQSAINDVPRATQLLEQVAEALPQSWKEKGLPSEVNGLGALAEDLCRRIEGTRSRDLAIEKRLSKLAKRFAGRGAKR